MLKLNEITKKYQIGDVCTTALDGVSCEFGEKEFVAILGTSGSGKTTLLNIVGGLDQYDSGDLVINGTSTKEYKSRDWDTYRNHSVGFVFQSYNLIPHQTVLANVELALTLSGVSKAERRQRAIEVLTKVGLGDQLKKKPNQMSGGQMQRVAIARALINNPEILLADEPTGALDTETSRQIMDLLSEISRDKLVIMVTHNPELAEEYATRIVRLSDGKIISDQPNQPTKAFKGQPSNVVVKSENKGKKKHTSMSVFTALSLSMRNLLTKKTRTFLVSFAGSIGIIGIALILSLSNGIQLYINSVQQDTLASYPISIESETMDMQSLFNNLVDKGAENVDKSSRDENRIYGSFQLTELYDSFMNMEKTTNNLKDLKKYFDETKVLDKHTTAVVYGYNADVYLYNFDPEGDLVQINPSTFLDAMYEAMGIEMQMSSNTLTDMYTEMYSLDAITELIPGKNGERINTLITEQYECIAGSWPDSYDEMVLIVNRDNEISDVYLNSLGILTEQQILDITNSENPDEISWSMDEIIGKSFYMLLPVDRFADNDGDGIWTDISDNDEFMKMKVKNGTEIKISGIIRPTEDSNLALKGALGYTRELTEYVIAKNNESPVIKQQIANPEIDVFNGLKFHDDSTVAQKAQRVDEYIAALDVAAKSEIFIEYASTMPAEALEAAVEEQMQQMGSDRDTMIESILAAIAESSGGDVETIKTYLSGMSDEELYATVRDNVKKAIAEQYKAGMKATLASSFTQEQLAAMLLTEMIPIPDLAYAIPLAMMDENAKAAFNDVYLPPVTSDGTYDENIEMLNAVDLESPESINIYASTFEAKDEIAKIIEEYNKGVSEENQITYTDMVAMLMSSVTTIINAISTVLIAFVSISLIVSSIMIGIITYISVLERTKEIGILRAIGASKKDISRVFNAEAFVIGLTSGLLGIGITALICIPANIIIKHLTDIPNVAALPVAGAVILVVISVVLTVIAGFVPSKIAAKKDPVIALRSE